MASAWVTHVKSFAQKHKIKYGEALKNAQCKSEYHKSKGKYIISKYNIYGIHM